MIENADMREVFERLKRKWSLNTDGQCAGLKSQKTQFNSESDHQISEQKIGIRLINREPYNM